MYQIINVSDKKCINITNISDNKFYDRPGTVKSLTAPSKLKPLALAL